jgi:hypothetical protein
VGNQAIVRSSSDEAREEDPAPSLDSSSPAGDPLAKDCRRRADQLQNCLGAECATIERAPFVLAGDLNREELDGWYRRTVGPAARAMASAYFRVPPDRPITILLFTKEASYNHYTKEIFNEEGISVYGYYKPGQRTLVMNIGTGGGTLVHELTHALIDFDFPQVPAWFNEGLASLHEQCRIRADESGIEGLPNWRLPGLQEAIRRGTAPTLREMMEDDQFRGTRVGLNYAQARYFCLYLQHLGRLSDFYHAFRAEHMEDPRGVAAALDVLPGKNWAEIDQQFRDWVLTLEQSSASP